MKLLASSGQRGQYSPEPKVAEIDSQRCLRPALRPLTRYWRISILTGAIALAGCSTVSLDSAGRNVDRRDIPHVPDPVGSQQATKSAPPSSNTATRTDTATNPVARPTITSAPNDEIAIELPADADGVGQLLDSIEMAGYPEEPGNKVADSNDPDPPGNLWDRIRSGFAMPELKTNLVAKKEKFYLARPDYLNRMWTRGGRYLYHIVEEIERRGMPMEIALLPFVESAMNPVALSHAEAAGLWQFIPSTGRAYNLKQNWWVDNRRDVVQSTRAALDYLEMLHAMHDGDWFLALASYNWGEGSVNRAIKRNKKRGRGTDYLSLRMPRETRHYVPKLIALKNIIANADKLGVALPELLDQPYFVVIEKSRPIDLDLAAEFAGLSVGEFVALNPAHNRPVISATRNNQIKIPAENLESFLAAIEAHESTGKAFATWHPYTIKKNETVSKVAKRAGISTRDLLKANGLSTRRKLVAGTRILVPTTQGVQDEQIAAFAAPTIVEIVNRPARYHRVKRRDTLGKIAKRWGVSTRTLRRWNGLKSNKLRRGQRLLVAQPSRQTIQTTALGRTRVLSAAATATLINRSAKLHTVKRGDTLSGIAKRYKVRLRDLRSWNRMSSNRIKVGQRLNVAPARVTKLARFDGNAKGGKVHKVRRGETLGRIASRYGVSVKQLRAWNKVRGNRILVGQKLTVAPAPAPKARTKTAATKTHRVRRGDTLSGIAARYRVSMTDLKRWNRLKSTNVMLGQRLKVKPASRPVRKVASNQTAIKKAATKQLIRHRVKRGDTLSGIAAKYGVSVRDLKRWNAIRGHVIQLGQKLRIEVDTRTLTRNRRSGKIT